MPTSHSPTKNLFQSTPKQTDLRMYGSTSTSQTAGPFSGQKRFCADPAAYQPPTTSVTNEDIMKVMLGEFKSISDKLSIMDVRITTLETSVHSLTSSAQTQSAQISKLTKERDFLLGEIRKSNLLIHGLPETEENPDQLKPLVEAFFTEKLGLTVDFDDPYRLGQRYTNSHKIRPVKIRFPRLSIRSAVLRARDVLKNLAPRMYISEDLAPATRLLRQKAYEQKLALEQGKTHPNPPQATNHPQA